MDTGYTAYNPRTGEPSGPGFQDASPEHVASALEAAEAAFEETRSFPPPE